MTLIIRNNNSGTVDYLGNDGNIIFTIDPINGKMTFASGAILDVSAAASVLDLTGVVGTADVVPNNITAALLTATLATGYIPLPLGSWRKVSANDVPNISASGGLLAKDTDPIFERVSTSTDKATRIKWAAASVVEIFYEGSLAIPIDMDTTAPLVVNVEAYMAGSSDTPTLAVGYWPGVGGANGGGNTGALSNALAQKTVSVASPGNYPTMFDLTIIPGSHGTDSLYLKSAWISYTRK